MRNMQGDEMSACGKIWYASEAEVLVAIAARYLRLRHPYALDAYYCNGCEGWHMGHNYHYFPREKNLCVGEMA